MSIKKIQSLKRVIITNHLVVSSTFWHRTDEELDSLFNGCGPEWLPKFVRDKLTAYFAFFAAAFLIHDEWFENDDKSKEGFDQANSELKYNCGMLNKRIVWWKRTRKWFQKRYIYKVCKYFGWSAWIGEKK